MISFNYENDFRLSDELSTSTWISNTILEEGFKLGEINYIFCNDGYLHRINLEFLNHDTLTDIISFDYSVGKILNGDVYISTERVLDNSQDYNTTFNDELHRVIIHGILHFCGYKDKSANDAKIMRSKENTYLATRK